MGRWGWLGLAMLGGSALMVGFNGGDERHRPEVGGETIVVTRAARVLIEEGASIGPRRARVSASGTIHRQARHVDAIRPVALDETEVITAPPDVKRNDRELGDSLDRQRAAVHATLLYLMTGAASSGAAH